jgi:hypothetical protein
VQEKAERRKSVQEKAKGPPSEEVSEKLIIQTRNSRLVSKHTLGPQALCVSAIERLTHPPIPCYRWRVTDKHAHLFEYNTSNKRT